MINDYIQVSIIIQIGISSPIEIPFHIARPPICTYIAKRVDAIAFKEAMQQPLNRIVLNIANPALFAMDTVRYENRFCYELISPPTSMDSLRACMRQDLERIFNITVSEIKKETEVLVLDTAARVTAYTRQGAPEWQMEASDLHKHLINQPVAGLVGHMGRDVFVRVVVVVER